MKKIILLFLSVILINQCSDLIQSDHVMPVGFITNLVNNQRVSGTVTINVKAYDNFNINSVEFFINNKSVAIDKNRPWQFDWNLEFYQPGDSYDIHVMVTDENKNKSYSAITTVIADTVEYYGPEIISPKHCFESSRPSVTFLWHPVQNTDKYNIDISSHADFREVVSYQAEDTCFSISLNQNGLYYWRMNAIDKNQNNTPFTEYRSLYIGPIVFNNSIGESNYNDIMYDAYQLSDSTSIVLSTTKVVSTVDKNAKAVVYHINKYGEPTKSAILSGFNSGMLAGNDDGYTIAGTNQYGKLIASNYSISNELFWNLEFNCTGEINAVRITQDNGYILTGYCITANQMESAYVVKINQNGEIEWTKRIEKTMPETGKDVIELSNGNFMLISDEDDTKINIYCLSPTGDIILQKTYDDGYHCTAASIIETNNRNLLLLANSGINNSDILLYKIDAVGNIISTTYYGGTDTDHANSLSKTNDGNYIITGYTTSFGFGAKDIWLINLNSDGNINWDKTYGYASNDIGRTTVSCNDSGFLIAAQSMNPGTSIYNLLLIKTDATGNSINVY